MENGGRQISPNSSEASKMATIYNNEYVEESGLSLHGVLHMYSGNDEASYAENSNTQRYVFNVLKPVFQAAIDKLTIPDDSLLRISDLGCAIGTNTVSAVDFVAKTLRNLCEHRQSDGGESLPLEIQAYFSDLPTNDFNGLFNLLARSASPYFVAGVPGSFYNVLFPRSSIHVCFSIIALQWLSEVPRAVVHKVSPLYNKGRVWINRGRQDIAEAYSRQSEKDLTTFMNCRAQEMPRGGVLFLCMMGRPDTWPASQQVSVGGELCGQDFENAWDELVNQGIINSDERDSFNIPWYFRNAEEVKHAVANCGAFHIESLQVCELPGMRDKDLEEYTRDPQMYGRMKSNMVKSILGSLVEAHIGKERSDTFFHAFSEKAAALLHCNPPSKSVTCTVASLIRN